MLSVLFYIVHWFLRSMLHGLPFILFFFVCIFLSCMQVPVSLNTSMPFSLCFFSQSHEKCIT